MRENIFRQILPLVLLVVAIIIATVLLAQPFIELVRDADKFRLWIQGYGSMGFIMFIIIQVLQVIVFIVPGEVVQIAGGYLYGTLLGTLLSSIGITIGSLICFGLARLLGRRAIESIIGYERIHKFDDFINQPKGEALLFLIFLIPGLPKDVLAYAAGLSPMRFRNFFVITFIARLPSIMLSAYWGSNIVERNYWLLAGIAVIATILFLLGIFKGRVLLERIDKKLHNS
ncbi:VTT domain-containing protein [Mahella sp.]|uniref:TVP38/TMEM64 family protein n=1 Tax=Mahella sp. TaxID=2798721 RepID=UPI0025C06A8C|nr:VTT domain-containing protein [Mahella sp.]MBZ4666642.1 associated Golgi protein-related protein [Mahella sp.]